MRTDDVGIMSTAEADPHSTECAHTWRAVHASALDRRVTAWRLLHGKLFVGAFQRYIGRGTPESHLYPHHGCDAQLATLSHVMLTCPVSQAVWHWLASLWTAISQQEQPPLHADLHLADDRRGPWQPPAELNSLWHCLRLLVIAQLWAAYCTARAQPEQHMTATRIAARVLAAATQQMRQDWLLVGTDIRLRAGVLSHWLRGRQPRLSTEQFKQRWCQAELLCSMPEEEHQPLLIHWTAAHSVPLPY